MEDYYASIDSDGKIELIESGIYKVRPARVIKNKEEWLRIMKLDYVLEELWRCNVEDYNKE